MFPGHPERLGHFDYRGFHRLVYTLDEILDAVQDDVKPDFDLANTRRSG